MGGAYDLLSLVRNLRSNKVTDRKRAVAGLKSALQNQTVLISIDQNTLKKVNQTWDIIAFNIIKAIEPELDKLAESTRKKPSAAPGTDLLAIVSLLQTVVKSANRRQPLLNPRKVVDHIQRVLEDSRHLQQLHGQYTSILHLLLSTSSWQVALADAAYNGLVDLVCRLLRTSRGDADVVGLSNVLHHLVSTGFYQDDAHLETVLTTLAASFVKLREAGAVGPVVLQLATLMDVGRRLAGRRHRLLCTTGESIARSLLVLFNWNSPQIKELALEFLALQLSLHGTVAEHDADDEVDVWQSLVRDWHHLLMQELQKRSSTFPGLNQQQARVRRAQVWLAAETLEQMEPAGGALATAVSTLQSSGPNRDSLPWLEVLACYLWKYPSTAGRASADLRKLLDILTQCHSSCKIQDVKRCVLLCYWGVARAHGPQAGKRPWPVWDIVWEQTVKTVFLNQCVEEGHLLLQELLRQGLVCSDLSCLLCPGRPLEPAALHSLAVLLSRAGSLPHLDVPPALLDCAQDVPVKHRWRFWLLELLVPGMEEGGAQTGPSTLVPAGELLAAVCLARPAAALASAESAALTCTAWQDPYPWRAKLEADLERRATAQPSLCDNEQTTAPSCKDLDSGHKSSEADSSAAVVEVTWEATLDRLSKQCLAFLESAEMLPACLYIGAMGVILLAKMCHLQAKEMETLFVSPPVKQLQGSLRDCTEKLLQELDDPSSGCSSGTSSASQGGSTEQKQPAWLGLLGALLSYVDGGSSSASSGQRRLWRWLLDALPQELGACLLSACRGPESTVYMGASLAIQPTPSIRSNGQGGMDSDDEWADENVPSCSATPPFRGSTGPAIDVDADFGFDTEQTPSSDSAATKCSLVLPERLTKEETERLACLRIGLCHFLLSRRVTGVVGSSEHTFEMLLHLLEGAEKNLTAFNIQAALLALRMLFEQVELMAEPELFSLLDALRKLMKVHYRQLDVLATLLDVARLCVRAVDRFGADSQVRNCFQVILQAYAQLLAEGILNEPVCLAFLRLLLECSQAQGQSWVQLEVDKRPASPLDLAVRFLGSPYDSVRTLAAQSMAVFLKGGDSACLDSLLPHIDKHLRTKAKSEDEHLSACLVLATALTNAALALGPHLGGVATTALLQAVRDSGLPATLAAKVLGCGGGEAASRDPWSVAHLPCVVHLWLKQDLPLCELPLAALGTASESQFLERHWRLVLPAAVECGDREAIKFVSDTLGRPARQLLGKVAPVVISRALASWDGQGAAPPPLRFLEACLSPEAVEQVLVDRIAEVLVSVLQLACNLPSHAKRELYPPCLGDSQVKATLLQLEKQCCALLSGAESLMDALLRKQDGLQLVLQGLQGRGARGEEPCPLCALIHLADLVAPFLASLKGSECYVLRALTLQLLRRLPTPGTAISTEEKRSTCLVARALHQLYEAAVPHMYKEAGRNLPVVINALAPFVDDDNIALGWEVQALVKLLLSDKRFGLPMLLVLPLPDCSVLSSCRGSLEAVRTVIEREQPFSEVLGAFAQSLKQSLLGGCGDAYELSALSAVLERHRTELTALLKEMQERPFFSEAAATSPLHQLVAILFQQARSPDAQVRAASLRCLGLLGPTELGLPALATAHWNPISGMLDNASEECHEVAYALLFSHMERYLCHPDTKTSDVACQALKSALATKSGLAFTSRHQSTDMEDTFAFLHPFLPSGAKARLLERPTGPSDLSSLELWVPEGACDSAAWIQNLVCTLVRCCDDQVFWALLPLCQVAADLCELLFPFVVETLADEGTHWDAVLSGVSVFLERHTESRAKEEAQSQCTISSTISSQPVSVDSVSGLVYCSRASVAVVMSAVERMVVRRKASATTLWSGFRLKVDLLKAAQAAEFCGNHAMAVQCVDLWWDWNRQQALSSGEEEEDHHGSSAPLLQWNVISSGSQQREAVGAQSVLLSALSGLGDPDALAGCRCLALDGGSGRTLWRHWAEQRGGPCWPTLLARADLEATGRNARLAHALKQCGLYHTLATYLDGCETPDLTELQAECAWRLADWDCRLPTQQGGDAGFQRGIFTTLSSMACHEAEGLSLGMNICRELLSCQLSAMPQLGSSQQLNQLLAKAQMCSVLEEGVALLGCGAGEELTGGVLARWEQRVAQPGSRFDFSEPVSWLQSVVAAQLQGAQVQSARTAMLAHYAVQARLNQCPLLARVALKELERCAPSQAGRWLLEEARIQLAQGDCTEAQHTLWTLLRQLREQHSQLRLSGSVPGDVTEAYAEVLQLYGACVAESGRENRDTIAREYFGKAVELLSSHHGSEEGAASLWSAHLRLARFADAQLQSIEQHLRSPEFRAQQELSQQSSRLLQGSSSSAQAATASREDARALRVLERQTDLDRGEAARLEADRSRYLRQAVAHYLQCLRGGPEHDLRLFRLASLWVGNSSMPEVNALLKEGLGKLASYKFVPLIYQLAARMSRPDEDSSSFSTLLLQLIERVVRDHPYQTLPVVLALCNAEKDPTEKTTATASRAKKSRTSLPAEDRVEGARFLVQWLLKGGDLCAAILPQLERLMDAYIQLAYIDPPSAPRGQALATVKLPRDCTLLKLRRQDLDKIPVLTQSVEVDQNATYCNLPGILKFSDEYRLCGGINQPKVITCLGQDGRKYKQLVKGRDDLRQDAVMQQAFGLVNRLLAQEAGHQGTGRLAMRTYKVVPLSRRSGVVQWCEGTQPFSEFLLPARTGAHQRYHPQDWTTAACRQAMQAVHKSSPEERLLTYQEICRHFHPVFRYFFFENFPEPSRWFERRRAYVYSVATGSIVGYILGLGDRHCANILVDKHSAELIHIDLGVAFEQGRILTTPETVPFRLTRDIVDGMGICGVEGTFRRCCERTMEVMRASRELLVTVVEVLLHDPLSSWTLSPKRVAALQRDAAQHPTLEGGAAGAETHQHDQRNRLARRMLLRLEQKLRGVEEGAPLSVAGQVNLLIQQAVDPQNLSRLFPGWQPYV